MHIYHFQITEKVTIFPKNMICKNYEKKKVFFILQNFRLITLNCGNFPKFLTKWHLLLLSLTSTLEFMNQMDNRPFRLWSILTYNFSWSVPVIACIYDWAVRFITFGVTDVPLIKSLQLSNFFHQPKGHYWSKVRYVKESNCCIIREKIGKKKKEWNEQSNIVLLIFIISD